MQQIKAIIHPEIIPPRWAALSIEVELKPLARTKMDIKAMRMAGTGLPLSLSNSAKIA